MPVFLPLLDPGSTKQNGAIDIAAAPQPERQGVLSHDCCLECSTKHSQDKKGCSGNPFLFSTLAMYRAC